MCPMRMTTVTPFTRRIGILLLATAASATLGAFSAGSANAAPGLNLPDHCLQFSQDGGTTWGGADVITWNNSQHPVPGGFVTMAEFQARNHCDTPAKMQVYAGDWKVTGGGSANVRAAIGTNVGMKELAGNPGLLVVESGRLRQDSARTVKLEVGIPEGETAQGFTIEPDFAMALEEVDPNAPLDGDDGNGNGNGSCGSSGTGSLGAGSSGSSAGSLGCGSGSSGSGSGSVSEVSLNLISPLVHVD